MKELKEKLYLLYTYTTYWQNNYTYYMYLYDHSLTYSSGNCIYGNFVAPSEAGNLVNVSHDISRFQIRARMLQT